MISKRELIERIMNLNRSARKEFLLAFTENELADYLRQLQSIETAYSCPSAVEASHN